MQKRITNKRTGKSAHEIKQKNQPGMKLNEGFEMRSLAGQHIIVPAMARDIDFTNVLSVNEVAAYIWQIMEKGGFTLDDIARRLTEDFDVTYEQAREDVEEFAGRLREYGMLEE